MPTKRLLALLIVLAALPGCGGPRAVTGLAGAQPGAKANTVVPILLATNRRRADDLSRPDSAQRSQTLNFAEFYIGIPGNHSPGAVETNGHTPDPVRHFAGSPSGKSTAASSSAGSPWPQRKTAQPA